MSGPDQSLVLPFADYIPKRRLIANITNTISAIVTTTEPHGYGTGLFVTLLVPQIYKMTILYVSTPIEVLSATQFRTALDLSQKDPFAFAIFPPAFTQAQVIPITGQTINNLTPIPPSLA